MKILEERRNCLSDTLKLLNFEEKELRRVIEDYKMINVIVVDEKTHGLLNGMVDLKRDSLLKLISMINDDQKIKNIFGMMKGFYDFVKTRNFIFARKEANRYLIPIRTWLGGSVKFTLMYKATRDGFIAEAFHTRCDDRGPTVVIITSSEGYVFGGYAAVSWNSTGGYTADDSKQSFVFSLKNPRNAPPAKFGLYPNKNGVNALFRNSSFGPCFGADINCGDHSDRGGSETYTWLGFLSYKNTTDFSGKKVFTGQVNFKAKEIEVYGVK